ncbi:hypothetical protein NQ314_020461 [Rhamnusium bicolor]|uniref:Uncharacterized protein n=1 Tax=Rhamnusium bicolor TaxID=1586634 RepID=A0AAV8WLW6_9CUCU|nr:hypothetical protein NQ314_020461 [Rhamnusium bicolor]
MNWDQFLAKKPVPGINHPDDEKLFAEAKDTIGDYKLKEADDYKLPRHLRETTVKKYKQLMDARLKQHSMRHDFCVMVYKLRDEKYEVRQRLLNYRAKLLKIHEELPESLHKLGPNIPEIDMAEFPEEKIKPNIILPDEEIESAEIETQQKFITEPNADIEERELLPDRESFPTLNKNTFFSTISQDVIEDVKSSSESSSSSSSEEDEVDESASLDSRDFGIIRQDLNVCPKGCEQAIYNLTIDLRTKSYLVIGFAEKREKQREMNQVLCTVVLHMDQLSGFNPETVDITELLVFSRKRLTELYERVGVLQRETYEQRSKYDTYLKHGTRMRKDINYMTGKIKDLKRQIVDTMLERFGQVVDIYEIEAALIKRSFQKSQVNELEEVLLKKLVYDLRIKTTDIRGLFADELKLWMSKISKGQYDLAAIIKENTRRLELLRVINREKNDLVEIVTSQPRKREYLNKTEKAYKESLGGIQKLEDLIEDQCRQLCQLKSEIKILKTKGLPPRVPICHLDNKMKEVAYEEEVGEWADYDEYIDQQYEETEEQLFTTEITIPGYYSTESKDIITDLITDLLENLDSSLARKSTENIVKDILSGILKCTSVVDIINEILNSLPFEPTNQQQSIIEVTAEKLYGLQEPEVSEDSIIKCANELLDDIIDEVLLTKGQPHDILAKMVRQLVESLPYEYLMTKAAQEKMVKKVVDTVGCICLNKEEMKKTVEKIPSELRNEMIPILNVILEEVYGMGLDYLYIIKQ